MKIRILSSQQILDIENTAGAALISAGLAEFVSGKSPGPPKHVPGSAAQPSWSVTTRLLHVSGGEELIIEMRLLGQVYAYSGNPEHANAKVTWDGGHRYVNGLGREIPADILQRYARHWKTNPQLRSPNVTSQLREASKPQYADAPPDDLPPGYFDNVGSGRRQRE